MKKLFLIIGLFILPFIIVAQKISKSQTIGKGQAENVFDQYIQNALKAWKTPGLSVVVVKGSEVVFKKAYGVTDIRTKTPYTTATLSACASTTKAMTAMCMAMLVDEGKVKWDDVVSDVLPEFKLSNPYTTAEITIKDLFTHNTGLGNADLLWVLDYSRADILHRMKLLPDAYSLRSSFIYQNLMYLVAGEVIKKLSGKTWDEFISERIFVPLGMNNTYADYTAIATKESRTTPHFKDVDDGDSVKAISYLTTDNVGAAGGVWSSIDDISKWLRFLNDSTKINGTRLLKPQTFAELFKVQAIIPKSEFYPTATVTKPHWTTYGLGWFQHDYKGKMIQFHTGSLDGLVAICGMIPDDHTAVYIFGNLDHSEIRHALMYKALDLWVFGNNNTDWSNDFNKLYTGIADTAKKQTNEELAKQVKGTLPTLALSAYTGKYTSEIYGGTTVSVVHDSLLLQFADGRYNIALQHWNYDTFRGTYNYWWMGKSFVQFLLDKSGKVSELSVDGIAYTREK
jgi:CubicO group peptidase (beta-lactamase class C family)